MSNRYVQKPQTTGVTRFTKSPMAEVEFSRMVSNPVWMLPFNAGDIVPVYYSEVLPHDTFSIDLDFVIRQMTALHPTMGKMQVDFYAYFVPNRIVNESWKNVQGENTSGFWSAPEVSLAPLFPSNSSYDVSIPVGSVADYYGFPTQRPIKASLLARCNDLKFRGYLEIYNKYFRDENYQAPIPYSKLNIYNGFLQGLGTSVLLAPDSPGQGTPYSSIPVGTVADGSYPNGAVVKELFGEGSSLSSSSLTVPPRVCSWSALAKPLKANKLHDAFTSGLPSPQRGQEVYFGIGDSAIVYAGDVHSDLSLNSDALRFFGLTNSSQQIGPAQLGIDVNGRSSVMAGNPDVVSEAPKLAPSNLYADLSKSTGISVNDLRIAVATQQVYEALARGGSRYVETLRTFFEIETENPFLDIPTELGHIRRDLDLYQVAQTSATEVGNTPQGELTAFGYTTTGGHLFTRTFLEHGYVHVLAVVRQRNIYSTYFAPDNFRLSTLDFYLPQFANIGEQPIRLATLNPFVDGADEKVLAYQEAWWEYRYEPDRVHGLFRTGLGTDENPEAGSLSVWNYADPFDPNFTVITGDWLKSNAEQVLNRTIAVTSEHAPQFKGLFSYKVDKQRPMPTYSVPGLDTI